MFVIEEVVFVYRCKVLEKWFERVKKNMIIGVVICNFVKNEF